MRGIGQQLQQHMLKECGADAVLGGRAILHHSAAIVTATGTPGKASSELGVLQR